MAKSKRKIAEVRAAPIGGKMLCSLDAFDTLCCNGYVRLSDNPEVLAAVNKICDLISSMTIYEMENTDSGDIRIRDGLARLVDISPSRYMTRKTFVSNIVKALLLGGDGNCVVIPKTNGGYIDSLDFVPPSQVGFIPEGIGYKILVNGIVTDPDNVLHFVINPNTEQPWRGTGYRAALKDIANNLKQATATQKGFMESKWKPSVIVKVDGLVDEFSTKEGRKTLLSDYMETSEAGEPWVIPADQFDVQVVKPLSLTDIALSDSVKLDKGTVASILGVPPFVVGVGEYKEGEWNNFINSRIRLICNAIEQELTRKLLYSPTRYFKFNVRSLYSYDIKVLSEVGANMYTRGIMSGNEVRDWLALSPKDGLDDLVILENYIPQGMIGDQKKLDGGGE